MANFQAFKTSHKLRKSRIFSAAIVQTNAALPYTFSHIYSYHDSNATLIITLRIRFSAHENHENMHYVQRGYVHIQNWISVTVSVPLQVKLKPLTQYLLREHVDLP